MRARIVKPGLFSDFGLSRLPVQARYLFVGLWCIADREGRLIDSPRFIAGQIFPHDQDGIEDEVARWLDQLEASGFIQRYQVDGGRYILVTNFKKHQQINHREAASILPAPPQQIESTQYAVDVSRETPGQCPGNARETPGQCPGNARAMPGPNGSGNRSGSGISGVRKLPYTPLTPHETSPPPLVPVENPVEISPAPQSSSQAAGTESPPLTQTESTLREAPSALPVEQPAGDVQPLPNQNQPDLSPCSAARTAAAAARVAVDEPERPWYGSPTGRPIAIALRPNARKISKTDTGLQRIGDFAIQVTRRMLLDWMERHADRLPPPDDEICRRLLLAHGMSLDRLRDWLLWLRRRGKRPEAIQSWGWFAHLAEADAEAARDGPVLESTAAAGGAA